MSGPTYLLGQRVRHRRAGIAGEITGAFGFGGQIAYGVAWDNGIKGPPVIAEDLEMEEVTYARIYSDGRGYLNVTCDITQGQSAGWANDAHALEIIEGLKLVKQVCEAMIVQLADSLEKAPTPGAPEEPPKETLH